MDLYRIECSDNLGKKELTGTDWMVLRYSACQLMIDLEIVEADISFEELDSLNAFQNDELYLYEFEGFSYDDIQIQSLYLNDSGRVIASGYDNDDRPVFYWVE